MVRRSFRLGLWAGVLFGIGFAIVKTVQSRRAASPASSPGREPWPPLIPTEPDRAAATATATPPSAAAPSAPTPSAPSRPSPSPTPVVPPSPAAHPAEAPRLEVVRDQPEPAAGAGMDEEEQAEDLIGRLSSEEAEPDLSHGAGAGDAAALKESPAPSLHLVSEPAVVAEPEVVAVAPEREPEPAPPLPAPPVVSAPEPVVPEVTATPPATRPAKKAAAPAKKAAKSTKKAAPTAGSGGSGTGAAAASSAGPRWVAPVSADLCPETHPVKAKLSSRLFHLPGMLAYARTRPDRCYEDAAAAIADGLTQAKR